MTRISIRTTLAAGLVALSFTPALAHDQAAHQMPGDTMVHEGMAHPVVTLGALELSGGFTRATLPNAPVGGGFLSITNTGTEADRLISASSPVAGEVQLHEMTMQGDVMKMQELAGGIPLPAGATVTLAPGGLHLMFMQLNQPFVEGESVPVTLTFEKAGTVEITLSVGSPAARDAGMDHAHHGDAGAMEHQHGSGMAVDQAGLGDVEAITAMQMAMFDRPGHPLTIGAIAVVGEYAVTGWAQDGSGGRALLRKTDKGWGIHLCAGDGLKDAAMLEGMGLPHEAAQALASRLADAEAGLDPALVAQFSKFDGVMMIDESLI